MIYLLCMCVCLPSSKIGSPRCFHCGIQPANLKLLFFRRAACTTSSFSYSNAMHIIVALILLTLEAPRVNPWGAKGYGSCLVWICVDLSVTTLTAVYLVYIIIESKVPLGFSWRV